jgi:regulator of replication initiation timing
MNALIKEIWFKPWKWKSTFQRLTSAERELQEARRLSKELEHTIATFHAENQGLRRDNEKLKTELQIVLNTIRVTNNLDRRAPKLLLRR